jgi:drug/metabolite transporter (DMT)-like permease
MWVLVTLVAAGFQTVRTALQHRLRDVLSVGGSGFVRYLYGAPLALAAVGVMVAAGIDLQAPPARFWPIVATAGAAQVVATVCLIKAFDTSNFAVGTVYSKTEVVQTAILSAVLLGEPLSPIGWVAAVVVFLGVVALATSNSPRAAVAPSTPRFWHSCRSATSRRDVLLRHERAMGFGLAAGGLFGITAICMRAGSTSLGDAPAVVRALLTLATMNTMQTMMQGAYLAVVEPRQITAAVRHWRSSAVVGVLSVCGSAGWTLAFTLQNAAKVRTLGQVELLFTFVAARWWIGERHSFRQYAAAAVVVAGVLMVVVTG